MGSFSASLMGFGVVAYGFRLIWVSVLSHMGFGGVAASEDSYIGRCTACMVSSAHRLVSTCLSVFNLSVYHFSIDLIGWPIRLPALLFPASPSLFVDSLDSELWYRFGCRAAALASSSTLAVGQSFRQLSPRGARSKGDQQPDGRVAHNQKHSTTSGVDISDTRHQ